MVVPVIVLLFIAATVILYRHLATRHGTGALLRSSLVVGFVIGTIRATLACAGWYVMEHTGGPLQVPAYALAMLAWPEAAVIDVRRVAPASTSFYPLLAGLLIVTSTLGVSAIALLVRARRGRNDGEPKKT
jgi:hypothetical protein